MKTHSSHLCLGSVLAAIATTMLIGCNKAPEAETSAPVPSTTLGTQVDDAVITASVKSALLADPDIKSFDISVVTFKGEVQLTGFVSNQGQIDRAIEIARATEGASSIKNELRIKQ